MMSEVGIIYLRTKGEGGPVAFGNAVDRAINNLTDLVEDKPIDTFTRINTNLLRDSFSGICLGEEGQSPETKRLLKQLKPSLTIRDD